MKKAKIYLIGIVALSIVPVLLAGTANATTSGSFYLYPNSDLSPNEWDRSNPFHSHSWHVNQDHQGEGTYLEVNLEFSSGGNFKEKFGLTNPPGGLINYYIVQVKMYCYGIDLPVGQNPTRFLIKLKGVTYESYNIYFGTSYGWKTYSKTPTNNPKVADADNMLIRIRYPYAYDDIYEFVRVSRIKVKVYWSSQPLA